MIWGKKTYCIAFIAIVSSLIISGCVSQPPEVTPAQTSIPTTVPTVTAAPVPTQQPGINVEILNVPTSAIAGKSFDVIWRVNSPDQKTIPHTAIHYGPESKGEPLALSSYPDLTSVQIGTIPAYYENLSKATYESIQAMVEPNTGLPHDRFDASIFDIMPQFAVVRSMPHTSNSSGASLESTRCTGNECRYSGNYGLKLTYQMPPNLSGSYSVDSPGFNVSKAAYLEAWVKGAQGGERFEFVLWSNCQGSFPGRPDSSLISVSQNWEQRRIPLVDFQSYVNLSSLCRLSIGFNDAIHSGGTIYIDNIAFVDADGNRIHVPFDEETSVTNIGLYIASELSALDLDYKKYNDVLAEMNTTLMSIEALPKWHGFPQTHNYVVSLRPSTGDTCISTVDMGNFAAGLIMLRQRMPELSSRVSTLLNAMEWDWLYDAATGLPYGCRYPDGSTSGHYDWLSADSRLAHFIGIGTEKIPPGSWNNLNRTPEQPKCSNLSHFEPGWDGGGLFMAFLPAIFIDEKRNELGKSARNFVQDQICYYQQIGAPAWGWSATTMPPNGADYCGYGICRRDEILVPHASILAAESIDPNELYNNLLSLEALEARQPVIDGIQTIDFGFRASLNWRTHEVATTYLVLDQSMAFLSLVNKIDEKNIRTLFCQDEITHQAIKLIPDYSKSCTVTVGNLSTITVSPSAPTVQINANQTFTAAGADADGNAVSITPVWSSSNSSVGTISSAGVFTAGAVAGTTMVNASNQSITGSTTVTTSIVAPTATATVTATPPGGFTGILAQYDTDHNGHISKTEAVLAVVDYFAGTITKAQAITVVVEYFQG